MAPEYGLLVTPPAQRAMDRLPERVAAAIAELLTGDLLTAPRRAGKPLRRELPGLWSARRGSYQVIYEIDDETPRVAVLRIDHRADVYRP
jgi:mRNA interferase RelE/StbE